MERGTCLFNFTQLGQQGPGDTGLTSPHVNTLDQVIICTANILNTSLQSHLVSLATDLKQLLKGCVLENSGETRL